ncbi:hypothetical protein [Hydrocarboniclastica marina]|uniref:Uncharacterized protein n=1 Tax=Hydrocarboniclastica marina TaxID=2259620 RepID=A0A4P7XIS9_9ALTE|nr:hypothetical protein [Hydrocarboniclastica marina]QCF27011.1 hypothetical protein soil367_14310 [Hydrocarboniclastica marina]
MRNLLVLALVILPLYAAFYAHSRLAAQTPNNKQLWLTHILLVTVGLAFGWAVSSVYLDTSGLETPAAFLGAFGAAHIPAAIILFLKRLRAKQLDDGH